MGLHQAVQVHDEIADRGIVDRCSGDRLPGLPRLGIARIQADDMEFRRVDEFAGRSLLELSTENEVEKLFVGMVIVVLGHKAAPDRFRKTIFARLPRSKTADRIKAAKKGRST